MRTQAHRFVDTDPSAGEDRVMVHDRYLQARLPCGIGLTNEVLIRDSQGERVGRDQEQRRGHAWTVPTRESGWRRHSAHCGG